MMNPNQMTIEQFEAYLAKSFMVNEFATVKATLQSTSQMFVRSAQVLEKIVGELERQISKTDKLESACDKLSHLLDKMNDLFVKLTDNPKLIERQEWIESRKEQAKVMGKMLPLIAELKEKLEYYADTEDFEDSDYD